MTVLSSNENTIQSIAMVTDITYFAPMGAFILTIIVLIVLHCINGEFVARLGSWLSGGYVEVVRLLTDTRPADGKSGSQEVSSEKPEIRFEQRLRVLGRLLRIEYQSLFTLAYIVCTLPLQAALIAILFIQNIFTEQFTSENCNRYLDFFSLHSDQYACYVKDYVQHHLLNASSVDIENATSYCLWQNETSDMAAAATEDIICRVFLFDKSKLIVAVGAIYGWHKLLSLVVLIYIHIQLFFTRKIRDKHLYYAIVCLIPIIFLVSAFVVYLQVADADTISLGKALSAISGIVLIAASIWVMSNLMYNATKSYERRRLRNFTTSYTVVQEEGTEPPLLQVQDT